MKIFLDTAEVSEIVEAYQTGLIDGVTTCLLYTSPSPRD